MSNRPDPRQYLRGFKEPYVRPVTPPMHTPPAPLAEQQYIGGMQQWERRSVLGNNIPDHINQMALLDERIELERRERERLEQERIGKEMHFMVESMVETATGGASTGDGGGPAIKKSSNYTWVSTQGLAWYNNVLAAGASISNANQAAFDTAFQALYNPIYGNSSNSTLASFMQSSAFLIGFSDGTGGAGSAYKGCFVPIAGTPVNQGFSSADFSRLSGLTGDGTSKYIDSGAFNDSISSKHLFVYYSALPTVGSYLIGSGTTSPTNAWISATSLNLNENSTVNTTAQPAPACASANRFSNAQLRRYSNVGGGGTATLVGGVTSGTVNNAGITVFGAGSGTLSNTSLVFYSVGTSFSSTSSELPTLAGIINTLRTSLT